MKGRTRLVCCAVPVLLAAAGAQALTTTVTVADDNWSEPGTWNNGLPQEGYRVDCRTGHTTVVDQDFTIGDSADEVGAALHGPGYSTDDVLYIDATLTNHGRAYVGMVAGGEGWLYVRPGGTMITEGVRFYVGSTRGGGEGKGHVIVQGTGTFTMPTADAWLQLGFDGSPGDTL